MSFSSKKGEFDRCFNRLDRPVEESLPEEHRLDRQPDRPVDPTGFHLWLLPPLATRMPPSQTVLLKN